MNTEVVNEHYQKRYNITKSLVSITNKKIKVLDIGCSRGILLEDPVFDNFIRFGIDIDVDMIKFARQNDRNGFYLIANAQDIPFPADFFDMIICTEVIEHLEDDQSFLQECKRHLKPKGILIISTPNRKNFRYYLGLKNKFVDKDHIREYTLREIAKIIKQNGFKITRIKGTYFPLIKNDYLLKFPLTKFIQYILGSLLLTFTYVFVIKATVQK